jgi:hypothetical protein
VQTYEFDLRTSDKFFLWLIQGDATQQGNQSASGFSSAFFNIAAALPPTSSSVISQSTAATTPPPASSPTTSPSTLTSTPAGTGTGQSDGLSTGALVGIAVGATLVLVTAISGAVYWIRKLNKRQRELVERLEQQTARLHAATSEQAKLSARRMTKPQIWEKGDDRYYGPVELG